MAGIVKIVLYDSEKDVAVETFVSEADAKRAETDIFFATELLTQAYGDIPRSVSEDVVAGQNADEVNLEVEEAEDIFFATELLTQAYGDIPRSVSEDVVAGQNADEVNLEVEEAEGPWTKSEVKVKCPKENVEENIGRITKRGHTVTASQCDSKLRSLKKTYKTIKDHNNKSGNDRRTWQYFQVMDEVYGKKAWCDPVAVASSTGLSLQKSENINTETNTVCPSKSNKTSIATLLAKRLRQKEEHEENKNKRHKERMEMDEKLLKVLEKFAEK